MELGALIPLGDIGGDPAVVRDYAQAVEAMGYDFLEAPDHVLGVNAASRPDWDLSRNTSQDLFHDPFVLFGFLAGCTSKLGFSTGVLILAQRQTVLVAKQAACLDVLCGGRFRLGIGVGWNEVEFVGLNENFHNRGRRSEEQVQVMQALWAQDARHVQGPLPHDRRCRHQPAAGVGPRAGLVRRPPRATLPRIAKWGDGWMPNAYAPDQTRARGVREAAHADARGGARSGRRSASRCGRRAGRARRPIGAGRRRSGSRPVRRTSA